MPSRDAIDRPGVLDPELEVHDGIGPKTPPHPDREILVTLTADANGNCMPRLDMAGDEHAEVFHTQKITWSFTNHSGALRKVWIEFPSGSPLEDANCHAPITIKNTKTKPFKCKISGSVKPASYSYDIHCDPA
jgi:hypothetical protein